MRILYIILLLFPLAVLAAEPAEVKEVGEAGRCDRSLNIGWFARQDVSLPGQGYAGDAMALAQLRALFEELTRVFSQPGFDTANPDIKTRLIRLEREINELKKVTLPDRPPPPFRTEPPLLDAPVSCLVVSLCSWIALNAES